MTGLLGIPVGGELRDRVRWLIRLRWVAIAVAAGLVVLASQPLGDALPITSLWLTVGAIAAYNVVFWVIEHQLLGRAVPYKYDIPLMHGQIVADLLALTILLHFSGGIENYFATGYVLIVVLGGVLMTRRGSYLYAGVATALWVGLLLSEATGLLPHHNLAGFRVITRYQETPHIITEGLVMMGANFGIAYLASTVMERLHQEQRKLRAANSALAGRAGELAGANLRLRESDRERSLFVRLVTHELRAPVAAIQSYLRLILDGYVPEERLHEIVGKAELRAREELELIGDLLDLAKLEQLKEDTPVEPADVGEVLQDVLDMMQARIQDRSLSLNVDVGAGVGKAQASEEHVKQVWTNLISNAVKYTPKGGRITVSVREESGMVRGSVQDTGIGIGPEEIERIFETFYRTDEAKAMSHHGTGLGLSIVKGITDRYGGGVWVESELDAGSTFFFELPIAA